MSEEKPMINPTIPPSRATRGKPPGRIKIGFRDYEVYLADHAQAVNEQKFGSCSSSLGYIWIDLGLDAHNVASTMLHELSHAIWSVWGRGDNEMIGQEQAALLFSNGFATVFRDNPKLVRWICKNLESEPSAVSRQPKRGRTLKADHGG